MITPTIERGQSPIFTICSDGPRQRVRISVLRYFDEIKDKYLGELKTAEIRVTVDTASSVTVKFLGFPGGDFSTIAEANKVVSIPTPDGQTIQAFVGGRDDAFFNDLTGFFRSINYAPQFYHVPHTMTEARELGVIACHPRVCTRALLTRLRVIPTCRLIFQEVGTIVSEPNTQLPNAPAV